MCCCCCCFCCYCYCCYYCHQFYHWLIVLILWLQIWFHRVLHARSRFEQLASWMVRHSGQHSSEQVDQRDQHLACDVFTRGGTAEPVPYSAGGVPTRWWERQHLPAVSLRGKCCKWILISSTGCIPAPGLNAMNYPGCFKLGKKIAATCDSDRLLMLSCRKPHATFLLSYAYDEPTRHFETEVYAVAMHVASHIAMQAVAMHVASHVAMQAVAKVEPGSTLAVSFRNSLRPGFPLPHSLSLRMSQWFFHRKTRALGRPG